ncbi:putative ABC-type transport system permease component [Coraliomargarita sp. CAG:312]|nr:putative ABC-type transport system permease component [Coraliomargarita sp. CAG:312]
MRAGGLYKNRKLPQYLLAVGIGSLLILAAVSLSLGSGSVGFEQLVDYIFLRPLSPTEILIIEQLRFPRVIMGILAGASLALAGAGMQSLFRNPLADPSITGVSAGSALGAVLAISIFPLSAACLQAGAIVCGLAASAAVCMLGRSNGRMSALSTLLAGIAINAFCGAIVGYCMYSVRDAGLKGFVFWTLGSLDRCDWSDVISTAALCIPSWIALFACAGALNVMLLGREQAYHTGINTTWIWIATTTASSVATAACVAVCGTIGFVGLVVPHIIRMVSTPDNRVLLPLSAVGGAALMTLSDIITRIVSPEDPIPIGVVTALIGAPVFITLLKGNKGSPND